MLLIHEFVTDETKDAKHARNDQDFRRFLHRLSGVVPAPDEPASRLAYYTVPGDPLFPTSSRLLIGKIVTNCRTTQALPQHR